MRKAAAAIISVAILVFSVILVKMLVKSPNVSGGTLHGNAADYSATAQSILKDVTAIEADNAAVIGETGIDADIQTQIDNIKKMLEKSSASYAGDAEYQGRYSGQINALSGSVGQLKSQLSVTADRINQLLPNSNWTPKNEEYQDTISSINVAENFLESSNRIEAQLDILNKNPSAVSGETIYEKLNTEKNLLDEALVQMKTALSNAGKVKPDDAKAASLGQDTAATLNSDKKQIEKNCDDITASDEAIKKDTVKIVAAYSLNRELIQKDTGKVATIKNTLDSAEQALSAENRNNVLGEAKLYKRYFSAGDELKAADALEQTLRDQQRRLTVLKNVDDMLSDEPMNTAK